MERIVSKWKCIRCRCFFIVVLFLFGLLMFYYSVFTNYSAELQAIGAISNIFLVVIIYLWTKKDTDKELQKQQEIKWFIEFLWPGINKEFDENLHNLSNKISEEYNKILKEDSKIDYRQKIIDFITSSQHIEMRALNRMKIFDSNTEKLLINLSESFYDSMVLRVSELNVNSLDKEMRDVFLDKIDDHRIDIYRVVFENVFRKKDISL